MVESILTYCTINSITPSVERDASVTITQEALITQEDIHTAKIPRENSLKMRTVSIGLNGKNILHSILAQVRR